MAISNVLWAAIQALEGQPLQTIGRGNAGRGQPFTVVRGGPYHIVVLPSRGNQRVIRRVLFDQALALETPIEQLRPVMLASRGITSVCASCLVGILRELHRRGDVVMVRSSAPPPQYVPNWHGPPS